MPGEEYPIPGFHFEVCFNFLDNSPVEKLAFKEVQGLTATIQFKEEKEGGQNKFVHKMIEGVKFSDLTLGRAYKPSSRILNWILSSKVLEKDTKVFHPVDLHIMLMNEDQDPLTTWRVYHAIPIEYGVSKFDAMANSYVVETLKLHYDHFSIELPDPNLKKFT